MRSEEDVDVEVEQETENQNENGLVIVNHRRPSSQMMNIFRALNIRMVSHDDDESNNNNEDRNNNFYILDNNNYNEGAMIVRNPNTTTTPTPNFSELFNNEYGVGSNFDLLLQHLIHMGTSSYSNGPNPPAKWDAVEALPIVINDEIFQCTICLEEVEIGSEVKEMPCEHKFHGGCIVAWLRLHCSCPVCRFQLPYTRARILTQYDRNERNRNNQNNRVGEEERNGNRRRNWFPVLQQSDNLSP